MSKKDKKYRNPDNKDSVFYMSSEEATLTKKPHYNAYAVGHGAHGDTKYNRSKAKQEARHQIEEEY